MRSPNVLASLEDIPDDRLRACCALDSAFFYTFIWRDASTIDALGRKLAAQARSAHGRRRRDGNGDHVEDLGGKVQ